MKKCTWSFLLVLAVTAVSFGIAHARGEYITSFNDFYGTNGKKEGLTLGSCITCHNQLDGKGGYNLYGDDLEAAGIKNDSFLALERTELLDSDKDGYTNLEEITAGTFPGDPASLPGEEPTNNAPLADAGADQTVLTGETVTLDGSGSSDADSDPLSFGWSFFSKPVDSSATLSDPAAANPAFSVDLPGTYVLQLTVNDGTVDSAPATVTISTINSAPVADAGPDQAVSMGNAVTLDGSNSSDVDGDPLTFSWSFVSKPAGSTATLSDPTAVMPTFSVDVFGNYVVELIIDDGTLESAADTVTISTINSAPVADAGPNQTVSVGETVILDASGSGDTDGDALTFIWSLTSVPANSAAVLSDPTAVNPGFVVDVPGTYVVQLIVNDGIVDSAPATVTISTVNSVPVADAGKRLRARIGETITLDGSKSSDADNDTLSFSWSLTSAPAGSTAVLSDPTAVNPSLAADLAGTYVIQLIVYDGNTASIPDSCLVKVFKSGNRGNGGSKGNGNGKGPGGEPGSGSQ